MKKIAAVFIVMMLICLTGCGRREDVVLRLDADRRIDIEKGQILRIEMDSNPTTGYSWTLSEFIDNGVLRQAGKPGYVRTTDRIGGGGVETYRFEGMEKGQAKLTFEYRRPWEEGKEPAKRYFVLVFVK
ncbi:MAG: protease inhibitor I42 family protein [Candidatus Omnitrophota bacterium]|nr:protease inhibitor I42 family protein [Candidatus Omnitrophota bacterium]